MEKKVIYFKGKEKFDLKKIDVEKISSLNIFS